jgi:hypothetical protein
MKKNINILIGLFVLLLIAAYLVLQKPGEQSASSDSAGSMLHIDSAAVDKVEIKTPTEFVALEKRGTDWFITQPISYRADQANVGQMIHQMKMLDVKNTISSKPEKHSLFQVDSTGTLVKVYERGAEKSAFILGKTAPSYTEMYARKANSDDVLLVEGVSSYVFSRPVKEWRDKTILSVPKENIKEVKYQYGDTTFTIAFRDSLWTIGKEDARQSTIDGLLSSLSNVQADDFIDGPISPAPKITTVVTYGDAQLRYSYDKAKSKYLVQSSNSPQWFIQEQWKANQILKRKKDLVETAKK